MMGLNISEQGTAYPPLLDNVLEDFAFGHVLHKQQNVCGGVDDFVQTHNVWVHEQL